MRTQTLSKLVILLGALLAWSGVASAQQWVPAPTPTADQGGAFKPGSTALQLTDGTIMVQEFTSSTWWKLTPDEHAHYNTGTWSKLASSVAYSPLDQITIVPYAARLFSSAVLPDGRVIIEGGEYTYNPDGTSQGATRTNMGAIYNPVTNVWTPVHPPPAPVTSANPLGVWPKIGDAPGIVLPNFTDGALSPGGTFMLGNIQSKQAALLDTTTTPLSWTVIPGTGKSDRNSEEGWTLLPNGDVLTVDTGNPVAGLPNNSEVFNPGAGTWTSAGNTKVPLSYLTCATTQVHEIGPAVLRPDGTVFATGVNTCGGAGNTAIYFANSGGADPWKATPKIPCDVDGSTKVCNDMADAPASILPDGNVLVQTSPGSNTGNSTFYEFDFSTNTFSPEIPPPNHRPWFYSRQLRVGPHARRRVRQRILHARRRTWWNVVLCSARDVQSSLGAPRNQRHRQRNLRRLP